MKEGPLAFAVPQRSKPEIAIVDTMEILRVHVFVGLPSGYTSSESRGLGGFVAEIGYSRLRFFRARSLALSQGSNRRCRENDLLDRSSWQGHVKSNASAIAPLTPGLDATGQGFRAFA